MRRTVLPVFAVTAALWTVGGCAGGYFAVEKMADQVAYEFYDHLAERPGATVAVPPLETEGVDPQVGERVADELTIALANMVSWEKLSSRVLGRGDIETLFEEKGLALEGITAGETRFGELLGADLLVTGEISPDETENDYRVRGRLVEVSTGIVLGGFSYGIWLEPTATP